MNLIASTEITRFLSAELAWRYRAIPHEASDSNLVLLIDQEHYQDSFVGELELITGYSISLQKVQSDTITDLLSKSYRRNEGSVNKPNLVESVVKADDFLNKIIIEAKDLKSSDIHIETYADQCRIRLRIDGKLVERHKIPKDQYSFFINKVKIKAGLDIAEKRLPQDGRIIFNNNNIKIDIRVSVLPALYGEKIVLRLLSNDASAINLEKLGLDERQYNDFMRILKKPNGIILISGPTGSGKTTTLYATLKLLNNEQNNILTVEDPIEYTLDGINQVQLKENIGLSFASALRSFLRQDPDIIMLGEIRDGETAQMAMRAALTGHLVLSTIHTNSAWGTISRLIDMGVPSFLLANTINMTVAQRLVRTLCNICKTEVPLEADKYLDIAPFLQQIPNHCTPVGCKHCFFTGYSGRQAIYEVIPVDYKVSQFIKENTLNINNYIKEQKISKLEHAAISLLRDGTTSLEEIYPLLIS